MQITAQRLQSLYLGSCSKLASVQLSTPALTRLDAHACHQHGSLDQPCEMTLRYCQPAAAWDCGLPCCQVAEAVQQLHLGSRQCHHCWIALELIGLAKQWLSLKLSACVYADAPLWSS